MFIVLLTLTLRFSVACCRCRLSALGAWLNICFMHFPVFSVSWFTRKPVSYTLSTAAFSFYIVILIQYTGSIQMDCTRNLTAKKQTTSLKCTSSTLLKHVKSSPCGIVVETLVKWRGCSDCCSSTWGESLFLGAQELMVGWYILAFTNRHSAAVLHVVAVALYVIFLLSPMVPMAFHVTLQVLAVPMVSSSKVMCVSILSVIISAAWTACYLTSIQLCIWCNFLLKPTACHSPSNCQNHRNFIFACWFCPFTTASIDVILKQRPHAKLAYPPPVLLCWTWFIDFVRSV